MVAVDRWHGLDDIPADLGPTVVTLGNFDGVHRGHREVLTRVVREAAERGATPVAVTFEPHPIAVLYPERAPAAVMSLGSAPRRARRRSVSGPPSCSSSRRSSRSRRPRSSCARTFVEALGAVAVVVGKDTRFGVRNSGDVDTLRELGETHGFDVLALDDIGEGSTTTRWSSTQLRAELLEGAVAHAAQILGRPHQVTGTVVHGDHRGRELGYPTANLSQDHEGLVPADGVYAGWLLRLDVAPDDPDRSLPAAISVGTNPTFDGHQRRVEAYVLDRTDLDLYGERVVVEFVDRLRPTLRFDSIDALVEQMAQDVARCREILSAIVPS